MYSLTNCAHSTAEQSGTVRTQLSQMEGPGCESRQPESRRREFSHSPHPLPHPLAVPEPAAVGQEHVQVALQGVLVEGAAQPGAAAAHVGGDVAQGVEALQLVLVEDLLHVEPEHGLCGESARAPRNSAGTLIMFRGTPPGHYLRNVKRLLP